MTKRVRCYRLLQTENQYDSIGSYKTLSAQDAVVLPENCLFIDDLQKRPPFQKRFETGDHDDLTRLMPAMPAGKTGAVEKSVAVDKPHCDRRFDFWAVFKRGEGNLDSNLQIRRNFTKIEEINRIYITNE